MKKREQKLLVFMLVSGVLVCLLLVLFVGPLSLKNNTSKNTEQTEVAEDKTETTLPDATSQAEPTEEPHAEEIVDFHPHSIMSTKPKDYISFTNVNVDGQTLKSIKEYQPEEKITFENGSEYTKMEGIVTFRGNNFRDNPVYGTTPLEKNKFKELWTVQTGTLTSQGKTWTGSGWTGQPLVVKWPRETKQNMNMYDWAKEKDNLVEVIYACLDGKIYFLDLKTGKRTRDVLDIGYTFKGAGALDPRGYPIMYVGAGYHSSKGNARVFVISLIDGSILHTFGNNDPFSLRGQLSYFDSSPLVDAETDTLIYPGESGVLYLIKLGTRYDEENGTLSISPERTVKWRYQGVRTTREKFWGGMEDSAVIYKGYLYIQDNGGNFMCLDLNKMKLVWVQDCLDDSNGSPVMSFENGKAYLYASTSFHKGWRSSDTAVVPIWKIDAETGGIVWQTDYRCQSVEEVSGGVQSTIAVGRNSLSDNIYVTVSRTGGLGQGVLACLSKETGERKWEHTSPYSWSSPVCVYDESGKGNVIYVNSYGELFMLDGEKGTEYDKMKISDACVEASPIVYNNKLVVGTRGCKIKAVRIR